MSENKHDAAGWKANVRIIMICLLIWLMLLSAILAFYCAPCCRVFKLVGRTWSTFGLPNKVRF